MLHELKMLRVFNYGYYCEEIWDEKQNHPTVLGEPEVRIYEADEFDYEEATEEQWEKYV